MKNSKTKSLYRRLLFVASVAACALTIMFLCAPSFAANGDPVISSFSFDGASDVALEGLNVTIKLPYGYPDPSLDPARLNFNFDFSRFDSKGRSYSSNALAIGAPGSTVTMSVQFTVNAEANPGVVYTTDYVISAVRLPPAPAQFSGLIDKSLTLPTTSITFSQSDFTGCYTDNGNGPMTGITIEGTGGSAGRLLFDGAAYASGTPIAMNDIPKLLFTPLAPGTLTYNVYAHNAPLAGAQRIGSATLRITVVQQINTIYLDDISFTIVWNTRLNFNDSDFNSVFRKLTGRNINYIRLTQPSTSYGRLYYNYTSPNSYDYMISNTDRLYRDTNPRIANVTFVPSTDYSGSFSINYTAYDNGDAEYSGIIRMKIESGSDNNPGNINNNYTQTNTVTYSTPSGTPVSFKSADFQAALTSTVGYTLSYIRFISFPSSTTGRLQYNYAGPGAPQSSYGAVTLDTRYYNNATPDISNISFIPNTSYSGTVNIPYNAFASNGTAFGGTLIIRIGQAAASYSLGDINYTAKRNTAVKLSDTDIQAALSKLSSSSFSYVTFTKQPDGGSLYFNYKSANDTGTVVTPSTRYYRATNPTVSNVTFVPTAGAASAQAGKVTIEYTAYLLNGTPYNGKIIITYQSNGKLKALTYRVAQYGILGFGGAGVDSDIRKALSQAAGAGSANALSYVVFNMPASSAGTLYKNYVGAGEGRQRASEGEQFYDGSSRQIASLAFEMASGAKAQLSYTAYTASGMAYDGKIALRPFLLPDSWAHDEVASLAQRGVIPEALLGNYGSMITRAEFTALLVNTYIYSGSKATRPGGSREAAFTDVSRSPYERLIRRGYSLGIIDGVSTTAFEPDSSLTREAAAKILCAAIALINGTQINSGASVPYLDADAISGWALQFVAYAYEHTLMIGDNTNMFRPQSGITREEAMALVERAIVNYGL